MTTHLTLSRLPRFLLAAACLAWLIAPSPLQAEEPAAARKPRRAWAAAERVEQVERQLQNLKAAKASRSRAETPDQPREKATSRYQMMAAGQRIVVLDTQTGETRIIEPETARPYQNVEVGRAWVVVTVLGNVSERTGNP